MSYVNEAFQGEIHLTSFTTSWPVVHTQLSESNGTQDSQAQLPGSNGAEGPHNQLPDDAKSQGPKASGYEETNLQRSLEFVVC